MGRGATRLHSEMSTAGCLPPLAGGPAKGSAPVSGTTLIGSLLSRSARLLRFRPICSTSPNTNLLRKTFSGPAQSRRRCHEVKNWIPRPAGGHRRERAGSAVRVCVCVFVCVCVCDKGLLMSLRCPPLPLPCSCLAHCPLLSADPMFSADQIDLRVGSRAGKRGIRRHRVLRHV